MLFAPECEPCIKRQIQEAIELLKADQKLAATITKKTDELFTRLDEFSHGLEFAAAAHELVAQLAGNDDVYKEMKTDSTKRALALYPKVKKAVQKQQNPLLAALKVAAAGNIIDAGALGLNIPVEQALRAAVTEPFGRDDSALLIEELNEAKTILIIGDNAGETVFDRLLLEMILQQLGPKETYYAVRSGPIINDATAEDAKAAGLDQVATIFDFGAVLPGMVFHRTSPEFQRLFSIADVVISKGQGNFEGQAGMSQRPVYYLLRAKCGPNARALKVEPGTQVLVRLPAKK